MSADQMPMAPIACLEIKIADTADGYRIGDQVKQGPQVGRLLSFECHGGHQAGAWVLFAVLGSTRGGQEMRYVALAELVRVKP